MDSNQDGPGRKGLYTMDEVDSKKDPDEEAAEDSPLKGNDVEAGAATEDAKENDATVVSNATGKDSRGKGVRGWLAKPRVKWWIAVLVAIVLLAVVLVGTLLAFDFPSEDYYEDEGPTLLRILPRPKGRDRVIHFRHGSLPYEGKYWPELATQLENLLEHYDPEVISTRNVTECFGGQAAEGYACFFDTRLIAPECTKAMNFGYEQGKPCVYLQFGNVPDWEPQAFTTRDLETLKDLPDDLRYQYKPTLASVDCQGDTIVDKENMGAVQYLPERGFRTNFFPYKQHPDYMPPLVAVRFRNPAVGVAISVTCKLWAKNVNHTDDAIPKGIVRFHLLID